MSPAAGRSIRRGALAGALALLVGSIAPAQAQARPAMDSDPGLSLTTLATARAHRDDRLDISVQTALRTADGRRARLVNQATATAGCDGCRAVALAIQVAVVSGVQSPVAAVNHAHATTVRCRHCSSVALSYQFVVASRGRLVLRPAARQQIEALIRAMQRLSHVDLPDARLRARENALAGELSHVLRAGVRETTHHRRPGRGRAASSPVATLRRGHRLLEAPARVGRSSR